MGFRNSKTTGEDHDGFHLLTPTFVRWTLRTIALAVALLLGIANTCSFCKFAGSLCLGLGALGYSVFWMLAALKAPGLGSTGEAKEALKLLAHPAAGLCILGLLFAFVALFKGMCCRCNCKTQSD